MKYKFQKPPLGIPINRGHPLGRSVVHCLMNEGTGNQVKDLSGNNRNGTIYGTAPLWKAGKYGTGLYLPGTDEYVKCATPAIPSDLSILFWYAPDNITDNKYMSDFGDNNEFACIAGYQDGYYNVYGDAYPTGKAADSQIPMSGAGILDFVCWVKSGTNLKGYVNGVLKSNVTISQGDFTPSANFEIGRSYGGVSFIKGRFEQVILYNRALLTSEIAKLYREPFCMFEREPIELWMAAMGGAPPTVKAMLYYQEMMRSAS